MGQTGYTDQLVELQTPDTEREKEREREREREVLVAAFKKYGGCINPQPVATVRIYIGPYTLTMLTNSSCGCYQCHKTNSSLVSPVEIQTPERQRERGERERERERERF
jgi:hypothetical protein